MEKFLNDLPHEYIHQQSKVRNEDFSEHKVFFFLPPFFPSFMMVYFKYVFCCPDIHMCTNMSNWKKNNVNPFQPKFK